jgi:hypothetical protein
MNKPGLMFRLFELNAGICPKDTKTLKEILMSDVIYERLGEFENIFECLLSRCGFKERYIVEQNSFASVEFMRADCYNFNQLWADRDYELVRKFIDAHSITTEFEFRLTLLFFGGYSGLKEWFVLINRKMKDLLVQELVEEYDAKSEKMIAASVNGYYDQYGYEMENCAWKPIRGI